MVDHYERPNARTGLRPVRQPRLAGFVACPDSMRVKVFEVMLHTLPSGKSPASVLEEQLNGFQAQSPEVQVVATHMNAIVAPAEPNALPSSEESTIIIFARSFTRDGKCRALAEKCAITNWIWFGWQFGNAEDGVNTP